jgi:cyclopropane-fatty-acyl-phospholipid synthase
VGRDDHMAGGPEPRADRHALSRERGTGPAAMDASALRPSWRASANEDWPKGSACQRLLLQILDKHLLDARIRFQFNGQTVVVGRLSREAPPLPEITVRVHEPDFFRKVICYGNLGMGEAYMAGEFEVCDGGLPDLLTILLRSRVDRKVPADIRLAFRYLGLRLRNLLAGKARNVQRHYDLGDDLFQSFLDSTLTYSCGYAESPDDDLERLQSNKLDRLCRKLRLQPGDHLLDIGCGYGGLLIHAARRFGVTGLGVTISRRHFEGARRRVEEAGLSGRVAIEFLDYRHVGGRFNKIVSVGMMEHLKRDDYKTFIGTIASVMAPSSLGLLHTIGCNARWNWHDPFIQRYVFPGSATPKLSEISRQLENHNLATLDVENMVRHYGYTVQRWWERFRANYHTLDQQKYDAVFKRMWEYYLACGIAAARGGECALYQVLFTNDYRRDLALQRL